MVFMTWIVYRLNDAGNWFYNLYLDAYFAGWPLDLLADRFLSLSSAFYNLAWHFSDFGTWVNQAAVQLQGILSWSTIYSNIVSYWPGINQIGAWFTSWTANVGDIVGSWWSTTSLTVQTWIDQAVVNIGLLTDQLEASVVQLAASWSDFWTLTWPAMLSDLGGLRSSWDNFLAGVLPGLATWTGVETFVNSQLTSWFPFYDELAAAWGGIQEFFADPEEWLYRSVDRIFERFW